MNKQHAVKTWMKDGLVYNIVRHPSLGHYCGYVQFPERPVKEEGYTGILTYVPIHGGITYARLDEASGWMEYGFDCAHAGDEDRPELQDINWLTDECERMACAIQIVAKYEDEFNDANGRGKAAVLDRYHQEVSETCGLQFELSDNFGAMMEVLLGNVFADPALLESGEDGD